MATYNYEAFGSIVSQTGAITNAYKFSTKNLDDESGLYYFGARYYDSETGRFIAKDPDGGDVTDPQSLNPYIYVRNNLVNLVDPWGLKVKFVGNKKTIKILKKAYRRIKKTKHGGYLAKMLEKSQKLYTIQGANNDAYFDPEARGIYVDPSSSLHGNNSGFTACFD
ncbi:MAG: RHS repeat-associated core domain-containing protein [Actinobacteria bacterium]|nr:RHS repeat-associated core domain-containing protein [Actinomycetota bacterium]